MATVLHPYTHDPDAGPYVIFPTHAHQILSNCIHLFGVSILSFCLARRTVYDELFSGRRWIGLPWTKICIMLIFLVSWAFVFLAGILINGVGLSYTYGICAAGIYACITLYATSKILIYCFLVERVYRVWSARNSEFRKDSVVHRICILVLLAYIAVLVAMLVGKIAFLRSDGTCVIGLKDFASIPLLCYDLFLNIFLTSLFVWPLCGSRWKNKRLQNIALRTLVGAAVALTTSSVNVAVLTVMKGEQGWICLGSCATDVTLNAVVLYWVTAAPSKRRLLREQATLPSLQMPISLLQQGHFSIEHSPPPHSARDSGPPGLMHAWQPPAFIHNQSGEILLLYADSLFEYSRSERMSFVSPPHSPTHSPTQTHPHSPFRTVTETTGFRPFPVPAVSFAQKECQCGRPFPRIIARWPEGKRNSRMSMLPPNTALHIVPAVLVTSDDDLKIAQSESDDVELQEMQKLPLQPPDTPDTVDISDTLLMHLAEASSSSVEDEREIEKNIDTYES